MSCDFFKLAVPGVQNLQPYQPGKPLDELEREYGIKNAIKLASNENPLGANPAVIASLQTHLHDLARYPDGNGFNLKQALARKFGVSLESITLGNGSNDVLEIIARTFVTPANSVIFSEYAFAVYPLVTQAIGAQAQVVPAKNWGHDLTAMQAAIAEKTRLIFIANPNNPTGTWVDKTTLKTFLDAVPPQVLVVMDEAYHEYAIDNPAYPNSIEWLATYPNLIVTRTFSKAFGLAGLRVGYAVSHPDIANLLNRVRQPFNVNSLALIAAEIALNDEDYLTQSIAVNRAGMQQLTTALNAMGLDFIPSLGNFMTINVGEGQKIFDKLLYEGVIVRPLGGYRMPQFIRVTIGTEAENEHFIQALQKVM